MTKTTNYSLPQWEATDALKRSDFNAAMATIDTGLAGKAEKSAVSAVETALANYKTSNDAAVGNKASATDVTALSRSVSALSAALGAGGSNCRIATGSYIGTGTYGPDNPTSLAFDFKPVFVVIACSALRDAATLAPAVSYTSFFLRFLQAASSTYENGLLVTWTDNSVSWYCSASTTNASQAQNNMPGYTHYWVALGVDE